MAETAAVAQANGHRPPPEKLATDLAVPTSMTSDNRASIDKDRRAGLPVESDAIIGDTVDRADAAGIDVPLVRATRAALGVYQEQRSAG